MSDREDHIRQLAERLMDESDVSDLVSELSSFDIEESGDLKDEDAKRRAEARSLVGQIKSEREKEGNNKRMHETEKEIVQVENLNIKGSAKLHRVADFGDEDYSYSEINPGLIFTDVTKQQPEMSNAELKKELMNHKIELQLQKQLLRESLGNNNIGLESLENMLQEERKRYDTAIKETENFKKLNKELVSFNEKYKADIDAYSQTISNIDAMLNMNDSSILLDSTGNLFSKLDQVQKKVKDLLFINNELQNLGNHEIEGNHDDLDIEKYEQFLNKFINTLQQSLDRWIKDFVLFHRLLLDNASKLFDHNSIDKAGILLQELSHMSDKYRTHGTKIKMNQVMQYMKPIYEHNSKVTELLVDQYLTVCHAEKQNHVKISKLQDEQAKVVQLKEKVEYLSSKLCKKTMVTASASTSTSAPASTPITAPITSLEDPKEWSLSVRLEAMTQKWKHSEETLVFERRSNAIKIKELEDEIRKLKSYN